MTANIFYTLDTDEAEIIKRITETLNLLQFVFTHFPELRAITKDERKKTHAPASPHKVIMNRQPFTAEQFDAWSAWIDQIIARGHEALVKQHPAYRDGHKMALARLRLEADDFIEVFRKQEVSYAKR